MHPSASSSTPPSRGRRRVGFLAAVFGGTVLAVGAWYLLRPAPAPEPPVVDLSAADPDVARAIEEARTQVSTAPRSARAWGKLGIVLVAHAFEAEALACFARAEQLGPREPRWPYLQGVTLEQGEPERAVPKMQRAIELCGAEAAPRLRLAELLLARGRLDEAEALFRQVGQADPDNPWALLGRGQVALAHRDLSGSLDLLRRAAERPPVRKAAHILLAQVYGQLPGNEADAEQARRQVADLPADQEWPDPYVNEVYQAKRGKVAHVEAVSYLRRHGQLSEALAFAREGTRVHPDSDSVWMAYGQVLDDTGNFLAAEEAYDQAVRLAPSRFEPRFRLGVALYHQKQVRPGALAEAALAFRAATRLSPSDARASFSLGRCLQERGDAADLPEAIAAYRSAVRHRPDYAEAHRNLGQLLAEVGRAAAVAAHLERLLGCPAALGVAAEVRLQALVHLRHASRLAPQDPDTRHALARLQREFP